jgi:hypothetical protein
MQEVRKDRHCDMPTFFAPCTPLWLDTCICYGAMQLYIDPSRVRTVTLNDSAMCQQLTGRPSGHTTNTADYSLQHHLALRGTVCHRFPAAFARL